MDIIFWSKHISVFLGTDIGGIPHICHFFTRAKFLENKIYTEKTRKLRQNTQKIANFLRYCGKIHSKLPIFHVKSVKIYTGQKKITQAPPVAPVTNMRYDDERGNQPNITNCKCKHLTCAGFLLQTALLRREQSR